MARAAGPEGRVVAIEGSAEQLAAAVTAAEQDGEAELLGRRVDLRQGDVLKPPLADDEWGTFDVAHARFVLEHVTDPLGVVKVMLAAVRPGGRIVLEDDDHDVLRLWPRCEAFEVVWKAYMATYSAMGLDPHVGRHLVELLHRAGARPSRADTLFFGGCAGQPRFDTLVQNFIGIADGAREVMLTHELIASTALDTGLLALEEWGRRPDASMWYCTCWAEGIRPLAGDDRQSGAGASSGKPPVATRPAVREARGPQDEAAMLRLLVAAAKDLSSTLQLDEVLNRVADRIKSMINCQLFCVLLWNEGTGLLEHSFSKRYDQHVDLGDQQGFPMGYGISGHVAQTKRPYRVPDVKADPHYVRFRHPEVDVRSELAVPLLVRDRLVGVLDLESTELDAFTAAHEGLLAALASLIASAVENAQLYGRVRMGEARLERELVMAREIQRALLPGEAPTVPGLDIGVAWIPALHLGGDIFDFLPYDENRMAMALGDVAGKAAPAALYGSMVVGLMRGHVMEVACAPDAMLAHLNQSLCRLAIEDRFLALAFALYDVGSRTVEVANAGLPTALVLSGGSVERLPHGDLALGIEADAEYHSVAVALQAGDILALASDGIEESRNADGEIFGPARTARAVEALVDRSAQQIADGLVAASQQWAGGREDDSDDRSVLILKGV
jgi:serine phosphatase RsbU (regulator of sigma subunit)/SAM-dependent methyltransferase